MAETYRTTLKLRRGYAEVWERNNPVLQEGEPGFALDTKVLKIGDGVTPWLELKGIDSNDGNYDDIFSGYDHFYTNIAQGQVNPEKPLEISTYDGSGQLTHPCVRYFPEGFGNHQFWMTASPYPYSALDLENPCVWYSDDGYEWSADGIPNPLDLPLMVNGEQASMNSDPHLLLRPNGIMEVWWRTNFWENSGEGLYTVIYRRTSTDGINWTEKEELYRGETNSNDGIVCPVALYEDDIYKIWAVSNQEYLHYFESVTGVDWVRIRDIDVSNLDHPEYKVWHFDVNHTTKGYEFVGNYNIPGDYTAHKYIYYAVSKDNITYSKRALILTTGEKGSFDERLLYRPTIIRLENQVRIYYGANNADNAWSIGMIEAPSAYLFNALLTQGGRIQAVEDNINELKNKTPIADGLTIVESFHNSPWLPGYWKPEEDGAFTVYGNLHHTQLVPLVNLMDGGQLAEITVTSNVSSWSLVRVNYFNGNLEWIGYDAGTLTDSSNGIQEPTPINWPAGAVYVAISANTTTKDDINIISTSVTDKSLTIVQSFDASPWLPGYWKPEEGGAMTQYGNFHHTQLIPLANLMDGGEFPDITAISSVTSFPVLRVNYFDGNLRWIGFDSGKADPTQSGKQPPTPINWPAGAVYFAISANSVDKGAITISGVPEDGDCEISDEQIQEIAGIAAGMVEVPDVPAEGGGARLISHVVVEEEVSAISLPLPEDDSWFVGCHKLVLIVTGTTGAVDPKLWGLYVNTMQDWSTSCLLRAVNASIGEDRLFQIVADIYKCGPNAVAHTMLGRIYENTSNNNGTMNWQVPDGSGELSSINFVFQTADATMKNTTIYLWEVF